jgi:uncharacterized protein YbcI
MQPSDEQPTAGQIGAEVANEVVRVLAEFTGRGATRSRAFVHGDVIVCLFEESITKVERSLIAAGKDDLVRQLRDSFQRASEHELIAAVERVSKRKVARFLSGSSTEADAGVEVFVLEPTSSTAASAS